MCVKFVEIGQNLRKTSECKACPFALFIADLQRAKRASEAPWVRKIGNPSS